MNEEELALGVADVVVLIVEAAWMVTVEGVIVDVDAVKVENVK